MQEVMARKGKVVLISDAAGLEEANEGVWASICMPTVHNAVAPILYALLSAAAGLSHGRRQGHGCGPAAQSGQIGNGGIMGKQFDSIEEDHANFIAQQHMFSWALRRTRAA